MLMTVTLGKVLEPAAFPAINAMHYGDTLEGMPKGFKRLRNQAASEVRGSHL